MKNVRYMTVLLLCGLALLLAGCNQPAGPEVELPEPSFAVGEPHSNAVAFRLWFETMTSTAGPCTVSIQNAIYDEERAEEWWYAIQSDLNTLNQALDLTEEAYTPFTVYIVEKTPNGVWIWNSNLYCTPEDILSGAYREGLIDVSLNMEPWKQAGLSRSLFGAEQPDRERIAAYLEDTEDLDILSLFAAYFVKDFATEEETAVAKELAHLLCAHVLAEHGSETLVGDACLDCRQELLEELGVERTYADPYGGFDQDYQYSYSLGYPMIVTTTRGDTFNLLPLPEDLGDLDTPADVRKLLYDAWKGPQVILEAMKTDAPEYAEVMAENYRDPITVNITPEAQGSVSFTYPTMRQIRLGYAGSIVHELMHLIIPIEAGGKSEWKHEACNEYFKLHYYPEYEDRISHYNGILEADKVSEEDYEIEIDYQIDQKLVELYCTDAGFPQSADDIDEMAYRKAELAAIYMISPDSEFRSIAEAYQQVGISILRPRNGNELSYYEAPVFADYLIREYSLSTFLGYCLDADAAFEDSFGVDYETAKAAWVEELMNM